MKSQLQKLLFIAILLLPTLLYSQYNIPENNVWMMSRRAGVDFNGQQPIPLTSEIGDSECSAAVSDHSGSLLFYTDGSIIWEANGNVMQGGGNINGLGNQSNTTSQGALIVPDPANGNLYYVFTLYRHLYLNVVDMSLNNGHGAVVSNHPMRGIIYKDTLAEKMIALRGCNRNIWVVVHGNTRNEFLSFEINNTGIDTVPVVSTVGLSQPGQYFQGEMKADPKGKRIVTCNLTTYTNGLELYEFDKASGIVYNPVIIDTLGRTYGAAFSPDGSKLYLSDQDINKFVQYDLNNNYAKTILGTTQGITQVKLAVDGKVYFISELGSFLFTGNSYLGCINKPNVAGTGCQFQHDVSTLHYPNSYTSGLFINLPNEVVTVSSEGEALTNRIMLDTSFCVQGAMQPITLVAFPGFTNYLWEDGSSGPSRTVSQGGVYWVGYNTACGKRVDTFKINTTVFSDLQILFNPPILSANNTYDNYQWYKDGQLIGGATASTYNVSGDGLYSLKVSSNQGCSDSTWLKIENGSTSVNGINESINLSVFPNPVKDYLFVKTNISAVLCLTDAQGRVLLKTQEDMIPMGNLAQGIYFLQVRSIKTNELIGLRKIVK